MATGWMSGVQERDTAEAVNDHFRSPRRMAVVYSTFYMGLLKVVAAHSADDSTKPGAGDVAYTTVAICFWLVFEVFAYKRKFAVENAAFFDLLIKSIIIVYGLAISALLIFFIWFETQYGSQFSGLIAVIVGFTVRATSESLETRWRDQSLQLFRILLTTPKVRTLVDRRNFIILLCPKVVEVPLLGAYLNSHFGGTRIQWNYLEGKELARAEGRRGNRKLRSAYMKWNLETDLSHRVGRMCIGDIIDIDAKKDQMKVNLSLAYMMARWTGREEIVSNVQQAAILTNKRMKGFYRSSKGDMVRAFYREHHNEKPPKKSSYYQVMSVATEFWDNITPAKLPSILYKVLRSATAESSPSERVESPCWIGLVNEILILSRRNSVILAEATNEP